MKKLLVFGTTVAAVAAAYFLWQRYICSCQDSEELYPENKDRHLTDVFSAVKQHAVHEDE